MLLDVSYWGHREIIEEQALVICVEEKIKEILAEREMRRSGVNESDVENNYNKLMKGEKIELFNL